MTKRVDDWMNTNRGDPGHPRRALYDLVIAVDKMTKEDKEDDGDGEE